MLNQGYHVTLVMFKTYVNPTKQRTHDVIRDPQHSKITSVDVFHCKGELFPDIPD